MTQFLSVTMNGLMSRINHWLTISPGAADRLKLTALVAMLADHVNTLLLTQPRPELYALGRMAFPLFVLIWARNVMLRPERLQIRANRMWLWAIVTQPAFSLAFRGHDPWYALNILFVFAGATQLLAWHHRYRLAGMTGGVLLLALMAWPLSIASYGVPGLVLALSLAIFLHHTSFRYRLTAGAAAFIALMALNSQHIQEIPVTVVVLAILPTVLLPAAAVSMATSPAAGTEHRFIPASFFYLAYIIHLIVFGLVRLYLQN
ncbi:conjugal transfer protein TraX (plasmid) [Kosakonia radicincitans]|uniref:TraX family protein n=1 Tax=Kosakonia radicincitans TaxID=283686 RepID=UPI0011EEB282|nr:TraX family protein [Kosakonia radicincitans]QEM94332.1 conjugal transfer protein TraX [Kosakonia radicincitans]